MAKLAYNYIYVSFMDLVIVEMDIHELVVDAPKDTPKIPVDTRGSKNDHSNSML